MQARLSLSREQPQHAWGARCRLGSARTLNSCLVRRVFTAARLVRRQTLRRHGPLGHRLCGALHVNLTWNCPADRYCECVCQRTAETKLEAPASRFKTDNVRCCPSSALLPHSCPFFAPRRRYSALVRLLASLRSSKGFTCSRKSCICWCAHVTQHNGQSSETPKQPINSSKAAEECAKWAAHCSAEVLLSDPALTALLSEHCARTHILALPRSRRLCVCLDPFLDLCVQSERLQIGG